MLLDKLNRILQALEVLSATAASRAHDHSSLEARIRTLEAERIEIEKLRNQAANALRALRRAADNSAQGEVAPPAEGDGLDDISKAALERRRRTGGVPRREG